MTTMVKIGEIGLLTYIRRLNIPNGVDYCNSDFKRFVVNDLATLCKNLVNFGLLIPEFKRGKRIHPSSISSLGKFA